MNSDMSSSSLGSIQMIEFQRDHFRMEPKLPHFLIPLHVKGQMKERHSDTSIDACCFCLQQQDSVWFRQYFNKIITLIKRKGFPPDRMCLV